MLEDPDVDHDYEFMQPIHRAALDGNLNILRYLICERGAKVSCIDNAGNTPLMIACMYTQPAAVQLLLSYGSDMYHLNDVGMNSLIIAADEGSAEIVRLLIENNVDVRVHGHWLGGFTALQTAVMRNSDAIVEMLKEAELVFDKCAAFAMAHHKRLGLDSMAKALDPEVLRMILERV